LNAARLSPRASKNSAKSSGGRPRLDSPPLRIENEVVKVAMQYSGFQTHAKWGRFSTRPAWLAIGQVGDLSRLLAVTRI
jgi:hypothetical protein